MYAFECILDFCGCFLLPKFIFVQISSLGKILDAVWSKKVGRLLIFGVSPSKFRQEISEEIKKLFVKGLGLLVM